MASATVSPPFESSQDKTNGFKLKRLIVDGGTEALRNVLLGKHPGNLEGILKSYQVQLSNLKRRKVITQPQWEKLYPAAPNKPNINEFDITLFCVLLRNICGLSAPSTGWDIMPPQSDNSPEANIVRIKRFRNDLYAHVSDIGVSATQFESDWKEISSALVGLGINQGEIDRLKSEQCCKEEVDRVMNEWNEMEVEVKLELKKIQQIQHEVLQSQHELKQTQQKILRETLASKSDEVLDKLAKCDFKVEIEGHCERFLDGTRQWIFEKVKNWFNDPTTEHRALVISGAAGVGKSVISAVICRDWKKAEQLAGCHFCQHNNERYSRPQLILQSLAYQMSDVLPQYKEALVKQLSRNVGQDLNSMGIAVLFSLLFKEPLSHVDDPGSNVLVVIDGVDESEHNGRSEFVDTIATRLHKLPCWIRFLVTTRPERNIAVELQRLKPLHLETNDDKNLKDIQFFFEKKLPCSMEQKNKDAIVSNLANRSEGLMLYAFFLAELVNENSTADISSLERFPVDISAVYKSYFKRLEDELCQHLKIEEDKLLCFLNAISVARQPLPLRFVTRLLSPNESSLSAERIVKKAISCISALLPIVDEHLNFFHKSVKDWLVDNSNFCIDEKVGHKILAELCTQEFDEVKKRGITPSQLSDCLKYALQHGIQHMLEVSEECESVATLVSNYSTDIELTYGKIFVARAAGINEILLIQDHKAYNTISVITKGTLSTLLSLLRKYSYMLKDYPHSFFQHVLNDGGKELSPEASHLLNTRYRDIPYLEFVDKVNVMHPEKARYYASDKIVCFDISPKQDYMVCRCANGSIELFSLKTGEKEWEVENCVPSLDVFMFDYHCYSVVFHPLENVVLPGRLDKVYTITGLCQPGSFSCEGKCSFSACSFSHDQTRMLTLCREKENQLLVWNLESDQMIKCIDCLTRIISFAFSSNGKLIAATNDKGMFIVYDVEEDYAIKHEIKHEMELDRQELFIISSCKSDSWFCIKYKYDFRKEIFMFQSDHLKFVTSSKNTFLPVGLNAVAEFEHDMLDRKGTWFDEVGRTLGLFLTARACFALLDGEMVLIASPELDYLSMFNLQQLKEIKNDTKDDKVDRYYYFDTIISLDGSIVYQIKKSRTRDNSELSVLRQETNECCNIIVNSYVSSLVPVKNGILLLGKNEIPELWNPDVSECLECFPQLGGTTCLFPTTEDLVGCRAKSKVDFLNIFNRKIVSTSFIPDRSMILACNSKYEVLIYDESSKVMSLWKKSAILWQCFDPRLHQGLRLPRGFFSAEGDKIIVYSFYAPALHILDASTGNYLNDHRFVENLKRIVGCCSLLVHGNEFLICCCENNFMYLISALSGELLTYLDVGRRLNSLSICLEKSLIAVGIKDFKDFKLIKVCITKEREDKSNVLSQRKRCVVL